MEGLIEPAENILAAGEVCQLRQPFCPYLLQLVGLVVVVDALAANFPSVAPFLQGGVVELASLMELVLEKLNLGLVGVKAVFVGQAHLLALVTLDVFAHHRRADAASVIAVAPKGRQARARRDELGSQDR